MNLFGKPTYEITYEDLEDFFTSSPTPREGVHLEFKKKWSDSRKKVNEPSIANAIAAFANTVGGWLFIGIDEIRNENKQLSGISKWENSGPNGIPNDTNFEHRIHQIIADNLHPYVHVEAQPVEFPKNEEKMVGVVWVPPSESAPIFTQDQDGGALVYVRRAVGKQNIWKEEVLASETELERLFVRRAKSSEIQSVMMSRSIERAKNYGIRERKYNNVKKEYYDSPILNLVLTPKVPVLDLYNLYELEAILQSNWIEINHMRSHNGLDMNLAMYEFGSQSNSVFAFSGDSPNVVIEFSVSGHVSISIQPTSFIDGTPYLELGYMFDCLLWAILFTAKTNTHSLNHILVMRLVNFQNYDLLNTLGANEGKVVNMDQESITRFDFRPNLNETSLSKTLKEISLRFSWAINMHKSTAKFEEQLLNHYQTIVT